MPRVVCALTILASVVVLGGQPAAAATVYMGPTEAHKTLRQAFAAMKGGDVLVIRDGVYTGPDNMINHSAAGGDPGLLPPAGSPGAYTIVRAEHEGQVTFDGELVRPTFAVTEWSAVLTYVEFHGLKWVRSAIYGPVFLIRNPGAGAKGAIAYVKFFRCGAHQPSALPWDTTWGIRAGDHLLFEECYAWGATRYLFMVSHSSAEGARKVIFRRCVARHDDVRGNANAVAGFMSYTAPEVEWQNCLYLDADTARWASWVNGQGFATRIHGDNTDDNYSEDLRYRGNIVLNLKGWGWPDAGGGENYATAYLVVSPRAGHPDTLEQNVAWDVMHGLRVGISDGGSTIDGLTVYCANDPAYPATGSGVRALSNGGGYPAWPTRNYVAIGHTPSLRYAEALVAQMATDYGAVYTNAPGPDQADFATFNGLNGPGAHDYTQRLTSVDGRAGDKGRTDHLTNNEVNPFTGDPVAPSTLGNGVPALKYLVRVEPGSNLYGTGEQGAHRGATILKRYGVAGSLWGDPGYNTLTEDSLWPFPYEAQIRADMRTYAPAGGPSGTRGFCADGQTLSHYIWGYLGHVVPPLGVTATPRRGRVVLSWAPPADLARSTITGYRIYRLDSGTRTLVGSIAGNLATSATISGYDGSTSCVFAMTTLDARMGESGLSDPATVVGREGSSLDEEETVPPRLRR
jgi:hypothetical protein